MMGWVQRTVGVMAVSTATIMMIIWMMIRLHVSMRSKKAVDVLAAYAATMKNKLVLLKEKLRKSKNEIDETKIKMINNTKLTSDTFGTIASKGSYNRMKDRQRKQQIKKYKILAMLNTELTQFLN